MDAVVKAPAGLKQLAGAENSCTRCPLYKNATQAVPGEGPARARIMMVGEQPGDREDLAGRPFVGPAGRVLDKAIVEAGIDRRQVFVTNAVKHFKFEPRGKRRLHKKPNGYEIERCRWWIDLERAMIKPQVVVAMGATAVRSLMHKGMTIGKIRGRAVDMPDGGVMVATIHPSYLLRIQDDADKQAQYRAFVRDLKAAKRAASANRAASRA
ncbi:MAG TPA: UdgX family uracil-DNA binding protein [Pseudolabrys sp.]|nr:UdgX family uracil-DNA binding protein [Pseudolabrys sp.]